MSRRRPELRALTATILLSTLALALAIIVAYAWWSAQNDVSHHTQDKVDTIAQFLENGMALLPDGGADVGGLRLLMARVGAENGARHLDVFRGPAVHSEYGPSAARVLADDAVLLAFNMGQDRTLVETIDGRRIVRQLKVMTAQESCLACHLAQPGEVLGVLDVSFDLARIQSTGPDFYRNLVLVALLVSVILVLLVFLVFSRVNMGRRIESVSTLAGEIASGDLEQRVAPLPGTGMDGLGRSINEMAVALHEQQETLECQQRELEESNLRLEVLVQESHHRIKNNLQTVADLLALQSTDCPDGGGSCLQDSIQRIKSIAAVHELLSVEQTESTGVEQLAARLLAMAVRQSAGPGQIVETVVRGDDVQLLSKEATAMALVLGELFNNALTHGLSGRPMGRIIITIKTEVGQAALAVFDDGASLPSGFSLDDDQRLGLRIVRTLVTGDLAGDFSLTGDESGTEALVKFAC